VTTFVNLTPHEITVRLADRDWVIPSHAPAHRVGVVPLERFDIVDERTGAPIPLVTVRSVEETALPDPTPDVMYIVSRTSATVLRNRADVVFPWPVETDEGGTAWCTGFARLEQGEAS
jgi:hypothetical protein